MTNENRQTWDQDPSCELTEWSDWSPCNKECEQVRTREYKSRAARKRCSVLPGAPREQETIKCSDDCEPEEEEVRINSFSIRIQIWILIKNFFQEIPEDCPMGDWSDWSPCSASCGPGTMTRTRVKLTSGRGILSGDRDYTNDDDYEPCEGVSTQQEVECNKIDCESLYENARGVY